MGKFMKNSKIIFLTALFITIIFATYGCGVNNKGKSQQSSNYNSSYILPSSQENQNNKLIFTYLGGEITGLTDYGKTLSDISIPTFIDGVKIESIGKMAFYENKNLISVIFPNTITKINDHAFYGCENIVQLVLPNSVTKMGTSVFGLCSNLQSVVLSNSLKSVSNGTFLSCVKLSSIYIPASVITIEESAFMWCSSLQMVTFSANNNITTIKEKAFYGCSAITKFVIPIAVKEIGVRAFFRCDNLNSVTFLNPYGWSVTKREGSVALEVATVQNTTLMASYLIDLGQYADCVWNKESVTR